MGQFLIELGAELKLWKVINTPQPAFYDSPAGDVIKTTVDFDRIAKTSHIGQSVESTAGTGWIHHPLPIVVTPTGGPDQNLCHEPPRFGSNTYFAGKTIVELALSFIGSLPSFLLSLRISRHRALEPS